jgi:hypothetical protein
VIGHVTAVEVAEHEVKVEAQINPGGLETTYEVWLMWQEADPKGGPTNSGERPTAGPQKQTGHIAAGSGDQTVSVTLKSLQWGYMYWYVVRAVNSACKTRGEGPTRGESPYTFALHISGDFPNGEGTGPPYESEIPCWSIKLSEEESAKTLKEYEAKHAKELEAQQAKEHQEQEYREAEARAAEATARSEREEIERDRGGLSLSSRTVMVKNGRTALVKLKCLGIAACKGKLTLTATGAAARKSKGNSKPKDVHPRTIGTASFSIKGDEEKTIDMALNQTGRALIGSVRRSVGVSLELQELAPAAGSKQTARVRLSKNARRRHLHADARCMAEFAERPDLVEDSTPVLIARLVVNADPAKSMSRQRSANSSPCLNPE